MIRDGDLDWTEDALCAQVGGDLWWPKLGGGSDRRLRAARAMCAACPVADACLTYALDIPQAADTDGIYAGTTPRQRRRLRRLRHGDAA